MLPVLHHKSKKGPPRQAKYAIHCIHAIFSSKETQFAQIFEVKRKIYLICYSKKKTNIHDFAIDYLEMSYFMVYVLEFESVKSLLMSPG